MASESDPAGDLQAALSDLELRTEEARLIARYATSGAPGEHSLFRVPTEDGQECLIETGAAGISASCLGGGLFARHAIVFMIVSDGGPSPNAMRFLRVVGVVAPDVARVNLVSSTGSVVSPPLNQERAFVYEEPLALLRAGVRPGVVVALDEAGETLERVLLSR